ncbi:MAG: hypothetical protein ACRD8A_11770 [Candidatus Acidiferrales bacterium]
MPALSNHPNDERFELYLKEFRPLPLAPLPLNLPAETATARKPRHLGITIWALSVAAILILGIFLFLIPAHHLTKSEGNSTAALRPHSTRPLTLRSANQLLVDSPSFKAALDSLESNSSAAPPIPKGQESALAVLRQEDLKP